MMNVENKCISTKIVENTRDVYSASKIVEIFMGSDTETPLINFLIHFLIRRFFDTLFDTKISESNRNITC